MITNTEEGLRAYLKKLNRICGIATKAGSSVAGSRSHYELQIEHILFGLLEQTNTDLDCLLNHFRIPKNRLEDDLDRAMRRLKTGNSGGLPFSPRVLELFGSAWEAGSILFGHSRIRSGSLIFALLEHETLRSLATGFAPCLTSLRTRDLTPQLLSEICGGSIEAVEEETRRPAGAPGPQAGKLEFLDTYTINLNEKALQGQIDPVLGREREVNQMTDILLRKRKNNPVLTGMAGVGKTAVVEGFVLKLVNGDVPEAFRDTEVRLLDLGLLQAGAGIKGEFENRLKGVIEDVHRSPKPVILFIDEIHTLVGAGASQGQGDAANLMKPALARGELRTIGATTFREYKKYFATDAALARRFQEVRVNEPDAEQAITMLRGVTEKFVDHHGVDIMDEAVQAAVLLSQRYIPGQQLPDKAIAVLDTAAARVALAQNAKPVELTLAEAAVQALETEIAMLNHEHETGSNHGERLGVLAVTLSARRNEVDQIHHQWERERHLVGEINQARRNRAAVSRLPELKERLQTLQGQNPLVHSEVNAGTVGEIISHWTGIPVGRMVQGHLENALRLDETLENRVVGQSSAIKIVSNRVRTSLAGLTDPRRPRGVFLFVGPSGVGKTETAIALAAAMFGGERSLVTINMSEYKEAYRISSLKGSAPGYVGYGEGGVLTQAVKRRPYSVVLLDEIEKAHPDVHELFFQVFDKGTLEDGDGEVVDFKNTIIILTSNVASDLIRSSCEDPETMPLPERLEEAIRPELLKVFKPALLGRMTVVPYYPLDEAALGRIIRLQLQAVEQRLQQACKASLRWSPEVIRSISSRCQDPESGARVIDRIIQNTMLPEISLRLLERGTTGRTITSVAIGLDSNGDFQYDFA